MADGHSHAEAEHAHTEHAHGHAEAKHGHDDCCDHDHAHGGHEEQHEHDGACCDDKGHGHAHGHDEKRGHDHEQVKHGHDENHGHAHEHEHAHELQAPSEDEAPPISWKVVSIIYGGGSGLCAIFGVLHHFEVEQVRGFWLIFAFFPACLLYSLHKHRAQRAEALTTSEAKKHD